MPGFDCERITLGLPLCNPAIVHGCTTEVLVVLPRALLEEGVLFGIKVLEDVKELAIGHPEDMLRGVRPLHAELHSPIVLHDEEVDD